MTDVEILLDMFCHSALINPEHANNKYKCTLTEHNAPDSSVTILGLPADALIIKIDAFPSPSGIFKCENGECKRADFVIISAERKCILYIEMKRTKGGRAQIVKQLQGAQCLIRYCQEVGIVFWQEKKFLRGYKPRFISIGHTRISKKRTQIDRKAKRHDTPDKAMKIDWSKSLRFNNIAGLGS